jgi:hypothetical protein
MGFEVDKAFRMLNNYRKAAETAEALKKTSDEQRDKVLRLLQAAGIDQARGELGTVSVNRRDVPQVDDWASVYDWVIRHKAPEIFQRRLSTEAWSERVANGKPIPGVSKFVNVTLSMRSK